MTIERSLIPDAVFDHVAIAARSIDDMLPLYSGILGGKPCFEAIHNAYGFRVVQLQFMNRSKVELLEPTSDSTFLESFLRRHPAGGLHHVTFRVPNIQAAKEYCENQGFDVFGINYENDEWREFFLRPKSTWGTLVQIVQSAKYV
ncbi:VOC family protein [Nocardia africana]|uniref:VOC family protein n=1 Tax=Nocardia africana TaxID=134964 RepID=A0ABW6NRJ8_9NOCA